MNRVLTAAVTALFVLFFLGCAAQKPFVPFQYNPEISSLLYLPKDLETRVLTYWSFKSNGLLHNAYEMEAPYIRELTPVSIYTNIFSKTKPLENMEVMRITHVNESYYEITLNLSFKNQDGSLQKTAFIDRWVKADETWFHVIKDPVFKNYFP